MKSKLYIVIFIILVFIFGLYIYKQNTVADVSNTKPKVVASIYPLYDIVRNIGGDEVNTVLVLPPGASPHTFDYTPEQVKEALGASAMFVIGHSIDSWGQSLARAAEINNIVVVDKQVKLIPLKYANSDLQNKDNLDPHYWMSIANAEGIAMQVKNELSALYPNKTGIFDSNYKSYIGKLEKTKVEISEVLKDRKGVKVAAFHDAYEYFANEFGIVVVSSFEEYPGKEPTPQYLSKFEAQIRRDNVKVIFAEPQFSTTTLEPIASDLGVKLAVLDPIGGVAGRDSYISLLKFDAKQIIENTK